MVTDLLRRPGAKRAVHLEGAVPDLGAGTVVVGPDDLVRIDAVLERIPEGIVVRGEVDVAWTAECNRCLGPMRGELAIGIDELFETDPIDGETYRLDGDSIDLEQIVRDHVVLELPTAPRCRDDCRGLCPTCGADRNDVDCGCVEEVGDPRWAALGSLEL
ncbi:MAG TPA: DUF177 domain-containing protein [Acidimicrobiia bacterium]|nr:DUF177 domain-containing protein [Acidimicrobiia bacterium]